MNKIETGVTLPEGSFFTSAQIAYATQDPKVMYISDSSFHTGSSFMGDEYTIITSSNAFCYESKLMLSGEALYAFSDVISSGVSLDASLGSLHGIPLPLQNTVSNDVVEGSIILKLSKQYGKYTVSIKPELTLMHLFGESHWIEVTDSGEIPVTATDHISYYGFGVRSSSTLRYDIYKTIASFIGFQIKSQQYLTADDEINHEIAYGMYGGVAIQKGVFSCNPFIALPFGATTSHFTSPFLEVFSVLFTFMKMIINGRLVLRGRFFNNLTHGDTPK